MTFCSVVNFRDVSNYWDAEARAFTDDRFVYIGRSNSHYGLPASPWKNPFRLERDTPRLRKKALEQYEQWFLAQPKLIENLYQLRDHVLVCWCAPLGCHGDILAKHVLQLGDVEIISQTLMFDHDSMRRMEDEGEHIHPYIPREKKKPVFTWNKPFLRGDGQVYIYAGYGHWTITSPESESARIRYWLYNQNPTLCRSEQQKLEAALLMEGMTE
jgi:hypothetical protein